LVVHERALDRRDLEGLSSAAAQYDIPVLVLSHTESGADGISADSLAQRVDALIAESNVGRAGVSDRITERLAVGSLVVDLDQHAAQVDGVPLDLTAKEFQLLCHFARMPGRIWSRQQLIDLIWGYDYVNPRVVTVHIGNLRKKLEEATTKAGTGVDPTSASGAVHIEAVRSVGYHLVCAGDQYADHPITRPATVPVAGDRRREPGRLPFVGREAELEVLSQAVNAAMSGVLRGVAIVGDPGIGKSRLADEAASRACERGARAHWGRCRDALTKPVYEPWVELLEQWKREGPVGEFGQVFTAEPPGDAFSPVDGESARLRLFDRITGAISRKAEAGTLCLIIDDLHWADPSTLLALQYVIGRLRDVPVLFLLTYRPGEASQAPLLTEVVADLVRGDRGMVLPLGPLSQSEVGLFVELSGLDSKSSEAATSTGLAARGGPAGTPGVAVEVYRETEGNPFFLTQLVRLRLLQDDSPEFPAVELTLSREEGVRRVVLSRLSRLSAPCREALDVASVIGREFTGPVLAGTMEVAPESLLERLAEAVDARVVLIRADAPDAYRFVHSIFQDVLQDELPPQRRALLHAKVGTVLERLHGHELDSYAADLAHHFSKAVAAGFASQAVEYCLRAGRVAVAQSAWDEARSHLQRAAESIDLLPAEAPQRTPIFVGRVWEELGDIHAIAVDADRALEAYQHAARRVPSEEGLWLARLKEKMAGQYRGSERYDEAMSCLAEAEALLGPPTGDAEVSWWDTWINVQRERGWLYFHQGRLQDLYGLLGQVEKTAEMRGGARASAHFDRLRTLAEWTRERFVSNSEVLRLAEECARSFRAAGAPGDLLYAERVLAEAQLWSPEKRASAYGQLVRYHELAERTRSVWHQLAALWFLQVWHRLRGEVDAVRDHALATLSLVTDPPGLWTAFGGEAKGHLSWVAWRVGDLDLADTLSTEALREIQEGGYSAFEWQARWTLLGLGLLGEHWDEASRQVEALLDQLQQKMPSDLEECLQRLVDERAQDQPPSSDTVEALTTTARAHGYL